MLVAKMYKILSLLWLLLPYTFIFPVKIGQSRDKILYILASSICILPSYDGSYVAN